jgi:hypothetical protein
MADLSPEKLSQFFSTNGRADWEGTAGFNVIRKRKSIAPNGIGRTGFEASIADPHV